MPSPPTARTGIGSPIDRWRRLSRERPRLAGSSVIVALLVFSAVFVVALRDVLTRDRVDPADPELKSSTDNATALARHPPPHAIVRKEEDRPKPGFEPLPGDRFVDVLPGAGRHLQFTPWRLTAHDDPTFL